MKKILFITTGGTIASALTDNGLVPSLSSEELLQQFPEIGKLCNPTMLELYHIDSTDMTPKHWVKIVQKIEENYAFYDGFIICHGTDTMAYTAAGLSYMIQNADKPIVLTGAQKPISYEITDAKKNLRDSVLCAIAEGSRGVMLVFDGEVIAGTRAKKVKTHSYDAFKSINFPCLAYIRDNGLVRHIEYPQLEGKLVFYKELNEKVFLLKLTPGIGPEIIEDIFRFYDCIIIESFGVGGIPQSIEKAIREQLDRYRSNEKILVMTTQVTYEGSNVGVYEVGNRIKEQFNILEAHDMTLEAVYSKIMWVLGTKPKTFSEIEKLFYTEINFDTIESK